MPIGESAVASCHQCILQDRAWRIGAHSQQRLRSTKDPQPACVGDMRSRASARYCVLSGATLPCQAPTGWPRAKRALDEAPKTGLRSPRRPYPTEFGRMEAPATEGAFRGRRQGSAPSVAAEEEGGVRAGRGALKELFAFSARFLHIAGGNAFLHFFLSPDLVWVSSRASARDGLCHRVACCWQD